MCPLMYRSNVHRVSWYVFKKTTSGMMIQYKAFRRGASGAEVLKRVDGCVGSWAQVSHGERHEEHVRLVFGDARSLFRSLKRAGDGNDWTIPRLPGGEAKDWLMRLRESSECDSLRESVCGYMEEFNRDIFIGNGTAAHPIPFCHRWG